MTQTDVVGTPLARSILNGPQSLPRIASDRHVTLRRGERHHALDALRGLAALCVAAYHFLYFYAGIRFQSMGTFSVYLLFSISALTMMMVYGERFLEQITRSDLGAFYRARAARILPLLTLVSLTYLMLGSSGLLQAFFSGTGLFALSLPAHLSAGTGIWSLGIELAFYAVFPALALLAGRWSLKAAVALTVTLVGVQQLYIASLATLSPEAFWDFDTVPLTFAPFFALGFVIEKGPAIRSPIWLLPACLSMTALFGASLLVKTDLLTSPLHYAAMVMLTAATLYCAWRSDLPTFARAPLILAGDVSYALYLTHWFVSRH